MSASTDSASAELQYLQPGEVDDEKADMPVAAVTRKTKRAWWPRRPRRSDGLVDTAVEASDDASSTVADPDTERPAVHAAIDDVTTGEARGTESEKPTGRRTSIAQLAIFGGIPLVVVMLALGAGYLKFVSASARGAEVAVVESVQAAKDGAVAMLSYTPDTADKSLSAARERMTGPFRDSYASLIKDVVIPGAQQKKVTAVATVAAAASVSATTPTHAVVLLYVNQAITMADGAPTQTNSIVEVTLDKSADTWLISGFDPK